MAISIVHNLKQQIVKKIQTIGNDNNTKQQQPQQKQTNSVRKSQARIVMLGLENSGKSSILSKLKKQLKNQLLNKLKKQKNELPVVNGPTVGFIVDMFKFQNTNVTLYEIGGLFMKTKQLAKHYFDKNDAVIFVVDSTDKKKLEEARNVLHETMQDPLLSDCTLLVLANKQDLSESMELDELINQLNLNDIKQKWNIYGTSAKNGMGLFESFDWISKND